MRTDVPEKRLAIVDEIAAKASPYPDAHPHAPLCMPAPGVRRDADETPEVLARVRTQLRDLLDRALIVASSDGKVLFATRRAQTLLTRSFPASAPGSLPDELRPAAARIRSHEVAPGLGARGSIGRPGEPTVIELETRASQGPDALLPLGLKPREAEVLFWLSEGKANSEVAIILGSARRTVEKHVEHILGKLHAENRAAAIRTALEAMGGLRD